MLEHCAAHLIGRTGGQIATLQKVAARAGFGQTTAALQHRQASAKTGPAVLNFFLMHFDFGPELTKMVISRVRSSEDREVRFAPIVMFTKDIPFDAYLKFIKMGFDDVIILPEKRDIIISRLSNQAGSDIEYFETADYFGPDRRRMETEPPKGVERSAIPHSHTRHLFRRDPKKGTEILRSIVSLPLLRAKPAPAPVNRTPSRSSGLSGQKISWA